MFNKNIFYSFKGTIFTEKEIVMRYCGYVVAFQHMGIRHGFQPQGAGESNTHKWKCFIRKSQQSLENVSVFYLTKTLNHTIKQIIVILEFLKFLSSTLARIRDTYCSSSPIHLFIVEGNMLNT